MRLCFFLLGTILLSSCSVQKTQAPIAQNTGAPAKGLPFSGVIDLSRLFAPAGSSLSLSTDVDLSCPGWHYGNSGLLPSLLRNSCVITRSAGKVVFGDGIKDQNGDGILTCEELGSGETSDFLQALCHASVRDSLNVKEATMTSSRGQNLKISFTKAGSFDVVGMWNNTTGSSFPALARLWTGALDATSSPELATHFPDNGSLEFWSKINFGSDGLLKDIKLRSSFKVAKDRSRCVDEPSSSNCLLQDVSAWFGPPGSGSYAGAPDGMRFRVIADEATSSRFIAIEGAYVVSDANARWMTLTPGSGTVSATSQTLFENARSVYFQVIRSEDEVWGRMVFKDANGVLANGYGDYVGIGPTLADPNGHCVKILNEGETVPPSSGPRDILMFKDKCEKIDASLPKFKSLWEGEANFTKPSAEFVGMPAGL